MNGTKHGKMGKDAEKWNQTWQNGEGEVHLATFTRHNTKRKDHNTACTLQQFKNQQRNTHRHSPPEKWEFLPLTDTHRHGD